MRMLFGWKYTDMWKGSRRHVPSFVSFSRGFQGDINLALCIFFLYVLWIFPSCGWTVNPKTTQKTQTKTKHPQTQKPNKKKSGEVGQTGKNTLPGNLPMLKAKSLSHTLTLVQPYQTEGGRSSYSTCFFVTKAQRKAICGRVGVSEQRGARGAKQPVLRIQHLCHECFSCLALAPAWSGPAGCVPWAARAREMSSGSTYSGLSCSKGIGFAHCECSGVWIDAQWERMGQSTWTTRQETSLGLRSPPWRTT